MSAWQFVAPAVIVAFMLGIVATAIYNPLSAAMREWSKRLEAEMFGDTQAVMQQQSALGFWVRQRSADGQSIVYAASSQEQGVRLDGVSVFTFDPAGKALGTDRGEARDAGAGPMAARAGAHLCRAASRRATATPIGQDQPDLGAGAGKLFDARNGAVLGASSVYRNRRAIRLGRGRL